MKAAQCIREVKHVRPLIAKTIAAMESSFHLTTPPLHCHINSHSKAVARTDFIRGDHVAVA